MSDKAKSKKQLEAEVDKLRLQVEELQDYKSKYLHSEKELERKEKRFQSVTESINVGLYRNTAGPKGKFVEANRALIKMFGYKSREEFFETKVSDLYLNPEDRRVFSEKLQRDGYVRNEILQLKKKDGTPLFCSVSAVAIRDEGGIPKYFDGIIEDFTEREEAEEALRQSEEKFRNIVESSPMGMHMYEINTQGELIFTGANQAADKILGIENSQFIGKTFEEAFPSLADTVVPVKYKQAAVQGFHWKTDQITYKEDRIQGAYEVYAFQTSPGKMVAVFLDVTERKQAEEALKESDERYMSLFERSLFGVYVHDFAGCFLDANQAALNMLGYEAEEFKQLSFVNLLDRAQRGKALKRIQEILQLGYQEKPSQFRLKTKDGRFVWVETEATLLYRKGEPFAIQGIARDVTEEKMAQEAILESEEKYRAIFESFYDVYYRTDKEGRITIISPSVKAQAGYDPEDVIGHPVTDFYENPSERDVFTQDVKEKGVVNDYELQLLAKDGRVIEVSASSKLVFDKNGRPIGVEGVLRDITGRKQAEEQLKASLKEKDVLLQEIHHRVKNNMQIVSSLINLQSRRVQDKRVKEMFKESRDRIKAMALIHEKLYQSKNLAEINLARYVESLVLHLHHIYRVDSNKVHMQQKVEDVFLDINTAIPFGLILNELLSNALKHAFPGGRQGRILLKLHKNHTKHHLLVKDNGVGFPKDFDFQNPDSLGIQLISDLVEQIGGTIELGRRGGTEFKISF